MVEKRRTGNRGRRAAATDQTRVLAAGVGGSNSETSVGSGRKQGTAKGQMGEPASEPGPVDGDYTGARFSILGICIVLPVNFNG